MKLSENFSLREFVTSETADRRRIDNTPNDEELENLKVLATTVLQPIRDKFGSPIRITSGYRCSQLNTAVGGSKTSQHMRGQAADIQAVIGTNRDLFMLIKKMIKDGEIEVGQLIWEKGNKNCPLWIHISTPLPQKKNQILYLK